MCQQQRLNLGSFWQHAHQVRLGGELSRPKVRVTAVRNVQRTLPAMGASEGSGSLARAVLAQTDLPRRVSPGNRHHHQTPGGGVISMHGIKRLS
jgi:hypothetical protein